MTDPDEFDAFYKDARARLLWQTFALTGDLKASRSAVRDSFIVAWHHWRKVSRLPEPETYVRPYAWSHAQRRHTARIWHRDRRLAPEVKATLDALNKLPMPQRKALILTHLATVSMADLAREIGLPRNEAERQLQTATAQFAVHRDVRTTHIRRLFDQLREHVDESGWPRSTILRRAGAARRRTHTAVGAAAAVAALLITGTVVTDTTGVRPTLGRQAQATAPDRDLAPDEPPRTEPPPPEFNEDVMLDAEQVAARVPGRGWSASAATDNTEGDGIVAPCQQTRFADPAGAGALMRSFTGTAEVTKKKRTGKGRKARTTRRTVVEERATAVEFVELSADDSQAQAAFETTRGWYADCLDARVQLLSTDTVSHIGDEATVLTLRTWNKAPSRIAVGLARTGQLTVTTLVRSTGAPVAARSAAAGLAAAVNATCGTPGAGACAGPPRLRSSEPYPVGKPSGLLAAVDLPPVTGAVGPWVGTDPERARVNFAATRCDNTQFRGKGVKHPLTRTFLFPAKKKVDTFGLTQTVATMKTSQARRFVEEVRNRIRRCGQANLGTSVDPLVNRSGKNAELTVWDLDVEISDNRTIQFWMAIMRDGKAVSQVGFTPAAGMTMARDDFTVIAERALERLSDLPGAKR